MLLPLTAFTPIFEPMRRAHIGLVEYDGLGNAGDRLREEATKQLLQAFDIQYECLHAEELLEWRDLEYIVIGGGGSYGVPRPYGQIQYAIRNRAMTVGRRNNIPLVLLPVSAMGTEAGTQHYHRMFVRDKKSLDYIDVGILAPDLILGYTHPVPINDAIYPVLLAFSRDPESLYSGTPNSSSPKNETTDPGVYLQFINKYKEIHTDSVSTAMCALIGGRDVTLYPTERHKQRSVWETYLRFLGCKWSDKAPPSIGEGATPTHEQPPTLVLFPQETSVRSQAEHVGAPSSSKWCEARGHWVLDDVLKIGSVWTCRACKIRDGV